MITTAAKKKWADTERLIQHNETDYAYLVKHGEFPFFRITKPIRINLLTTKFRFVSLYEGLSNPVPTTANHFEIVRRQQMPEGIFEAYSSDLFKEDKTNTKDK